MLAAYAARLTPHDPVTALELSVVGVTMGSRDDLLLNLLVRSGVRPLIDTQLPLARTAEGLARLAAGAQFGKIVVTV